MGGVREFKYSNVIRFMHSRRCRCVQITTRRSPPTATSTGSAASAKSLALETTGWARRPRAARPTCTNTFTSSITVIVQETRDTTHERCCYGNRSIPIVKFEGEGCFRSVQSLQFAPRYILCAAKFYGTRFIPCNLCHGRCGSNLEAQNFGAQSTLAQNQCSFCTEPPG